MGGGYMDIDFGTSASKSPKTYTIHIYVQLEKRTQSYISAVNIK